MNSEDLMYCKKYFYFQCSYRFGWKQERLAQRTTGDRWRRQGIGKADESFLPGDISQRKSGLTRVIFESWQFTTKLWFRKIASHFVTSEIWTPKIFDRYQSQSQQRFWPCPENRLIKTIPTIPQNIYYVSFKSNFPWIVLFGPNLCWLSMAFGKLWDPKGHLKCVF